MKKLFSLIALFLSLTIYSHAGDTSIVQKSVNQVTQAVRSATNIPDSASLTFSKVYTDVKTGIAALASSLKVGAEHVYGVLVMQQIVKSITYVLWLPFSLILAFFLMRGYKYLDASNRFDEAGRALYIVFGAMLALFPILVFMFNIETIVTGFVNPEYGAIIYIISIVK